MTGQSGARWERERENPLTRHPVNPALQGLHRARPRLYGGSRADREDFDEFRESDLRAGFVTREQFASIRKHLPEELQVALTVAFTFGWRSAKS